MGDKLTTSTVVFQNSNLMAQEIDGDLIIMQLETDEYYGMQSVANRIWQLIENPVPVSEVVDVLATQYKMDRATIEEHTLEFLQELLDESLISIK